MVELVDAADSKSAGFTPLRVQVALPVPVEGTGACRKTGPFPVNLREFPHVRATRPG